jgi:hypothetical protein
MVLAHFPSSQARSVFYSSGVRPLRLVLVVVCVSAALPGGTRASAKEHAPMQSRTAAGTFTVKMQPPQETRGPGEFVRLRLDKRFEGGLAGTSEVEMLASNAGDQPSGGYVALERFTGMLDGRAGTFVMQHSGTMSPAGTRIEVQVSPGSGTGALAGIEGRLTIRIEGKQHFYELQYSVPE